MENKKIVQVEVIFRRIGVIDTINQNFQAVITVKSSWIDNNVTDSYKRDKNWNPKLFISNLVSNGDEVITYLEQKDENNNIIITEKRNVKGKKFKILIKGIFLGFS